MSSSIRSNSEREQRLEKQSSKPRNVSMPLTQAREANPPNATSNILNRPSTGVPFAEKDVSQLQLVAAASVKKPLGRRLTGVLGGVQRNPDASKYPVTQRPFQADEVRPIKKNIYDAYRESVDMSLEAKWHDSVHPKLRKNVEAVIQGLGLQQKEMVVCVGLSMVGPKQGDMLHLVPTIVISCAHEKAGMRIEKLIESGQLDYLREFGCPHLVSIRGRDPKNKDRFFAETECHEEVNSPRDTSKYYLSSQRQEYLKVTVEQFSGLRSACGLRIEFMYPIPHPHHDHHLQNGRFQHQCRMMARIGGIIYIEDQAFALTTAHTFLLHEPTQESDAYNDSDSVADRSSDSGFGEQEQDGADYVVNHKAKAIQTNKAVWMKRNNLHGSFAFCDSGRTFDCQDPIEPISPNSDWCTLSTDSINGLTNHYSSKNEKGRFVEVTVDKICSEEIAKAGDVHILDSPENPTPAYMTQTMVSVYVGGKSLSVRRLVSKRPFSPGVSGCWVIRGKQLLGHIIGGNEFERTLYMVGIQDTKRAIEELTGGVMSLKPKIVADVFVEEPGSADLEDSRSNDVENRLLGPPEVVKKAQNKGRSSSVMVGDDSDIHDVVSREIAQYRATKKRGDKKVIVAIEKSEDNPPFHFEN